jgi:hypothetical protein
MYKVQVEVDVDVNVNVPIIRSRDPSAPLR